MLLFISLILLLFIVPDLYLSVAYLRHAPMIWRLLFFVPTLLGLGTLVGTRFFGFSNGLTALFMAMLLCFALPKSVLALISLVAKFLGIWSANVSTATTIVGIVVAGGVSLMALYGLTFGWRNLETKHVDLYFDNLPASFDGYRIAHLSDLHVGTYGKGTRFLEKVVRAVNDENPDLVVFTGDIVNTEPEELRPFQTVLSRLSAADGVVSVLGNHDYCLYGGNADRWSDVREGGLAVADLERTMGWGVLMNEAKVLCREGERIAVVGVENTGKPPFPQIGDLKTAVNGITGYDTILCQPDIFTILLSHDPSHWRMEVLPKTHIPLMLSGHTHAAQFKIGHWSPSKWLYKEWSGQYQEDNQQLYVSEGIGGTLPFRFGTRPQIILVTLHRK